jgi:enterobacteria phage integrase
MSRIKLRYVDRFVDAIGKVRHYFRRGRGRRVLLPGLPGSPEFMEAYQAALEGSRRCVVGSRSEPGTFDRLVQDYFASPDFLCLATSSQRAYRLVIERWVREENIGRRRVDQMRREHVAKMLAKRVETPGAANDLLKKIRILIGFAIANGLRADDPTLRMKRFAKGHGHHTWTEEEIAVYEEHWPAGTRERMAFALLLHTGQRLSDVVPMSWPDISDNSIRVRQQKTREKLTVPLHPRLKALLDGWSRDHMVLLATGRGKPFSTAGFGNWMAHKIAEAGLPERCVTHGLRKAAARRLAEAGCTPHQIMAVTGHRSLSEVENYTRAARQKELAAAAISKQVSAQTGNKDSQK